MNAAGSPKYTLWQLVCYMLKLGSLGFGGSLALVGYMHRDLVEHRAWISEAEYKEGLAITQLAPGPLSAQLAIYFGYVHYRIVGATLAGFAFVLPSFLMIVAIGRAYTVFGGLGWLQAAFYGVGAGVVGMIIVSTKRLAEKNLGDDKFLWVVCFALALITACGEADTIFLYILAGVAVWFVRAPPKWVSKGYLNATAFTQLPAFASLINFADSNSFVQLAVFFTKAGVLAVGSGLTILPFLHGGAVLGSHWITEKQFIDAIAIAMITPGPVVIVVAFIGYLVSGFTGACIATIATLIPCYLFTLLLAPHFKRYGKFPAFAAFVDGVTAAAIGATCGAAVVIGRQMITDMPTALIAGAVAVLLWRFRNLQEPGIVAGCGLAGMVLYPGVHL